MISQQRIETLILHGNFIRFVNEVELQGYSDLLLLDLRFQDHHNCVYVNTSRQFLIKGACEMVGRLQHLDFLIYEDFVSTDYYYILHFTMLPFTDQSI